MKRRLAVTIPTLQLALGGVALAAAATGGALVRALHVSPPTTVVAETITVPSMVRAREGDPLALTPIADDPFHPSRTPPEKRYRLADAMAQAGSPWGDDMRGPIVLGTVVGARDSSFAICSIDNEPPKTIRVGETIGGYRAQTIERGKVVFLSPEGRKVAISSNAPPRRPRFPNGFNQPFPFDPQNGFPQGDVTQGFGNGEQVPFPGQDPENSDQD